jgi:maltose O-acetyltransferase
MAPMLGSGTLLIQPRNRDALIEIGNNNLFSNNITLCANEKISIGHECLIGDQVAIYDCDFHEIDPTTRHLSCGPKSPVVIGNNVWLGSRVIILKGVTIEDNTVVGAMSLVTKSIPSNCVAAGIPAHIIRHISKSDLDGKAYHAE